ncbi:MAG: response regulator [Bdellovibrionota bacterium]|nr:response regulator [Bdellovibrionota bacterium]
MKVLVVDDNLQLRLITEMTLKKMGMEVETAVNGKEALGKLHADEEIGFILLDIMMPELDGIGFLEQARELLTERDIDVCMLTALGQMDKVKKCLKEGAADYLVKPVDKELLADKLRIYVDGSDQTGFREVKMDCSGKILLPSGAIDIKLKSIYENGISFTTVGKELPTPMRMFIECDELSKLLGQKTVLIVNTFDMASTGRDEMTFKSTFIAMDDALAQALRRIIINNEDLIPKKEEEQAG